MNIRKELRHLTVEELKNYYLKNSNEDIVLCLNLKGEINIGMIVRSASLFGMKKVMIVGRRLYDKRTSVGMQNYIPIEKIKASKGDHNEELDYEKVLEILNNYRNTHNIVFIEQGGESCKTLKRDKPSLFVLGTEENGIPEEILKSKIGNIVSINQKGVCPSFNVSHAFSIVMTFYYSDLIL